MILGRPPLSPVENHSGAGSHYASELQTGDSGRLIRQDWALLLAQAYSQTFSFVCIHQETRRGALIASGKLKLSLNIHF